MGTNTDAHQQLNAQILALCLIALQLFCQPVVADSLPTNEFLKAFSSVDAPLARPFGLNFNGSSAPGYIDNEIGSLINTLAENYRSLESRQQNAAAFVGDLDKILTKTRFANILKCRNRIIADPRVRYKIRFYQESDRQPATLLFVTYLYETNAAGKAVETVELNFNLSLNANAILPLYIHELVHICRTPEQIALESELSESKAALSSSERRIAIHSTRSARQTLAAKSIKKIDRYNRARRRMFDWKFLREIEGNYVQQIAFEELLRYSLFIGEQDSIRYDLRHAWLEDGSFAQRIAHLYSDGDHLTLAKLNDQSAESLGQSKFYKDPYGGSNNFSMLRLKPEFKAAVQLLGIQIDD
jgi:hypothetical protein